MNIPGLSVFARFKAKPGQEDHVRRTLLDMIEPTMQESASIGYALHAAKDDPTLFLLYEQWQDAAGLDAHMQQPYFAEMRRRLDGALEQPADVITSTMIGGKQPSFPPEQRRQPSSRPHRARRIKRTRPAGWAASYGHAARLFARCSPCA
jgi:quinol monooxygenase YgiN